MKDLDLIETLRRLGKAFYTVSDLEKITELKKGSLYVALSRLAKRKTLAKAGSGIYILPGMPFKPDLIAAQLYTPSYLSFESALSAHGLLNPIPYALLFATTRRTKKISILNRAVEYRQLKPGLFFGFEMKDGIYLAEAEKAFLDLLYFRLLGKAFFDEQELDYKLLSKKRLADYSSKYPAGVARALKRLSS